MMKNKICWITSTSFLDTDIYIAPLMADHFDIDWFIINRSSTKIDYAKELESLRDRINPTFVTIGAKYSSKESLAVYYKSLKAIAEANYDLIYTSMADFPYYIPLLWKTQDIRKVIMAIHNVHVPKGGVNYRFMKLYNAFTMKCFKYFHTFSMSQHRELCQSVDEEKILLAPFVLKDYGEATRERNSNAVTFLNFGNVRDYKRLDVLIDAAEKVYEKTNIPFRIIIAGSCNDWQKYQALVKHEEIFDFRIARVENDEIPNLFNESDFFVAPYQDIAQSGSSIVAINYGKPIIASDLEAFREYITDGETGYLIRPADADDLAEKMLYVIEYYNEVYPQMRNYVEGIRDTVFSKNRIVEQYSMFFRKVIDEQKGT